MLLFKERHNCPVCYSEKSITLINKPYKEKSIFNFLKTYYKGRIKKEILGKSNYILMRCQNCSLIYQKEILDENGMSILYEKFIDAKESLNKRENAKISYFQSLLKDSYLSFKICQKKFNLRPKELNLLDFGMGWGHWLIAAKSLGLNAYGSEISEKRLEFAKSNGLKVIDPFDSKYENYFHFINTDQVFEHLPDPNYILSNLVKTLKNGGIIKIFVPPQTNSYIRLKFLKEKWSPMKDCFHPLEHINSFNYRSLINLTKKYNLFPLKTHDLNSNIFRQYYYKFKLSLNTPRWYFQKII